MIRAPSNAPAWAHDLCRKIDTEITQARIRASFLPAFTVAEVATLTASEWSSAVTGFGYTRLIYVTDETGGAVPAFSDGTNFRRVTDRAVVS